MIAPFLQDLDGFNAALNALDIPVLLAYGTEDSEANRYQQLDDGLSDIVVFEGVGHALPTDLEAVFERASDLIAER